VPAVAAPTSMAAMRVPHAIRSNHCPASPSPAILLHPAGRNDQGQLATGSPSPPESVTPLLVAGGQYPFTDLAAGANHACGVLDGSQRAVCWGEWASACGFVTLM
jgi:hypothetical protein